MMNRHKRRKKDKLDIIYIINKKQRHFTNTERMCCVRCTSNNVIFKNKWELIPHINEGNLVSNIICKKCNHQFMDKEWDK